MRFILLLFIDSSNKFFQKLENKKTLFFLRSAFKGNKFLFFNQIFTISLISLSLSPRFFFLVLFCNNNKMKKKSYKLKLNIYLLCEKDFFNKLKIKVLNDVCCLILLLVFFFLPLSNALDVCFFFLFLLLLSGSQNFI